MDFWDLVKVMWRRWYVTAPMLLVTAAAAAWISITVGPEYQATGHVAVVPPEVRREVAAGEVSRVNPWNEEALAHAASIRLGARPLAEEMAAGGYAGEWSVEITGTLPVLAIEVVAPTAEQALDSLHELQAAVEEEVRQRQEAYNIPEDERIGTVTYGEGESIETTSSRLRRTLVAVVGAGLILTTAVVVIVDAVSRWRRKKQGAQPVAAAQELRRRYAYLTQSSLLNHAPHMAGTANGSGSPAAAPSEFPLPVNRAAEPVSPPAPKSAPPADKPLAPVEDSTVVLPLANVPWAGRSNGGRGSTRDKDRSDEASTP